METQSFWEATTAKRIEFPVLEGDIEVDVAIIGGGITGVTATLQLTNHLKYILL